MHHGRHRGRNRASRSEGWGGRVGHRGAAGRAADSERDGDFPLRLSIGLSAGLRTGLLVAALIAATPAASESGSEPDAARDAGETESLGIEASRRSAADGSGTSGTAIPGLGSGLGRPGIDSLLQLPSGYTGRSGREAVAGVSESAWRRRFEQTNQRLTSARAELEATKVALDGAAVTGGANQWAVAAPGGGQGGGGGGGVANSGSPLSFKLRQKLRKHRNELDTAEKAMKELVIEADLAGVPAAWRGQVQAGGDQPPPEVGQLLD